MSGGSFIAGAIWGALVWAGLELAHSRLQKRKARRQAQAEQAAAPPAAPTPKEHAPSARWFALPGNRVLELGLSGYSIELVARPGEQHYRLIDPEGDTIARTSNLDSLKAYAEHLAAQREEFVYRARTPDRGAGAQH